MNIQPHTAPFISLTRSFREISFVCVMLLEVLANASTGTGTVHIAHVYVYIRIRIVLTSHVHAQSRVHFSNAHELRIAS